MFPLCLHDSSRASRLLTGITVPILITLRCGVKQACSEHSETVQQSDERSQSHSAADAREIYYVCIKILM